VLRRILGPKKDKITGCWRKLQNEKLFAKIKIEQVKEI
jgi:hypothetical protein